jgi:hypothetical protein
LLYLGGANINGSKGIMIDVEAASKKLRKEREVKKLCDIIIIILKNALSVLYTVGKRRHDHQQRL